jgi:hypothetical protein
VKEKPEKRIVDPSRRLLANYREQDFYEKALSLQH